MSPLFVTAYTAVTALGAGRLVTRDALRDGRSALRPNDFEIAPGVPPLEGFIGRVDGLESERLPESFSLFDCRNNRLALAGLRADDFEAAVARAKARYGASRVAVLLGTSTSGILSTELAYRNRDPQSGALPSSLRYEYTHNFGSLAKFVRQQSARALLDQRHEFGDAHRGHAVRFTSADAAVKHTSRGRAAFYCWHVCRVSE